jgi:galactoside O-acetyltransferase
MSWLTKEEIQEMSFASVGREVLLSSKASYYGCQHIIIGDRVRIDDFCILSAGLGGIHIGNYVHIAAFSLLIGRGKILIEDFSGLSSRVSIYSSSDDYSGYFMTNPMIPPDFTNVYHADVNLGRHCIVGSGSVVLPGVTLDEGVAIGALSLVNKSCESFGVYSGIPVKRIKNRQRNILELEKSFLDSIQNRPE